MAIEFGYDLKDERLVKNENAHLVEMIFDKHVNENIGIKGFFFIDSRIYRRYNKYI